MLDVLASVPALGECTMGPPTIPKQQPHINVMAHCSGCRMHPHGVLCVSAWATYASDGAGFSEKFPGIDMRVGAP